MLRSASRKALITYSRLLGYHNSNWHLESRDKRSKDMKDDFQYFDICQSFIIYCVILTEHMINAHSVMHVFTARLIASIFLCFLVIFVFLQPS